MGSWKRQSNGNTGDEFLDLISDPFQAEIQVNSIYASIIWSFAVSGVLFILFVLFRPKNTAIYAPRAKHADSRHAPPPVGKGYLDWTSRVRKIPEEDLVDKIGLDAVVFLRFIRMLRNIFLMFSVLGCGVLIPITVTGGSHAYRQWPNIATLLKFTPQYTFGQKMWAYVVLAYIFEAIVCCSIWWNYRAVLKLRRAYFNSHDYRKSLHSRTILIRHIPQSLRSDDGISKIVDESKAVEELPRVSIARDVKDLPHLLNDHERTILKLEAVLAKYLSNPNQLPAKRPTCKPFKGDKSRGTKVDAIDYLTVQAHRLETEIKYIRESLGKRGSQPYGFASFTHVEDAHAVAYTARKSGPHGTEISLAPKPTDLIWRNLPMTRTTRRTRITWDTVWMILLTILFIPLNILSSVFLSDFSHLGLVWSGFQSSLDANPVGWGIAQGILAPTFQFLIFMALPVIFRRLYNHAGDASKTTRERHVFTRLYAFFVVNNLVVFSIFGSAFRFLAAIIEAQDGDTWDAIKRYHPFTNFMAGLCNVSTFWLTYQMQQNLSAAIDIAQLLPLITRWFKRKFSHPTPRQLIQLSAPQPFDYASYYNNYAFVATVGFCFGILQPIIFPITAFYLLVEVFLKRYMHQYIVFTKNESGGVFWRTATNRLLFAILLANAVVTLIVGAQGVGSYQLIGQTAANAALLYAMIPLPFAIWAFKWYCARQFDNKMRYILTRSFADLEGASVAAHSQKRDRVAVRFGHPALYRKLLAPMVHAKSEHLLKEIIADHSIVGTRGIRHHDAYDYSDMYVGEASHTHIEQPAGAPVPFEVVQEEDLDFENFKKREEFRAQFGGDGELYGRVDGTPSRPSTPSTTFSTLIGDIDGPESRGRLRDSYFASGRQEGIEMVKRLHTPVANTNEERVSGLDENAELAPSAEEPLLSEVNLALSQTGGPLVDREGSTLVDVEIPVATLGDEDVLAAGQRVLRKPVAGRK